MKQDRFRCHFSVIFENMGSTFWFLAFIFLTQIDDMTEIIQDIQEEGLSDTAVLVSVVVVLAVLLLLFLYQFIVWSKTWVSIEEDAIILERRTLNRKSRTIGMGNISNINLEQNLFERLVGTYKVKLDTDSRSTANETDVKIVLSKEKAFWFKEQVMSHMNKEKAENEPEQIETYDVVYSAAQIIGHCLYTASITSVLFLLGIIIGAVVGIRSMHTGAFMVDSLVNVIGSILAVFIIAISILQSLVKDFFVYYGFRVKRKGDKIYLHHGLLKTRQYALSVDKINAVQVVTRPLSRMFGRQYVKLICVGVGDEKNENSMLLLSEKKEEMYCKLSILLPEFVTQESEITKREKSSLYSELPGGIVMFGIAIAVAVLLGGLNILELESVVIRMLIFLGCVLFIVYYGIALWMNFRTCGIGFGENALTIVNGTFGKTVTWVPYHKIQQIRYVQGPVSRHFGLATGVVYVLAQVTDSVHAVSYFKLETYEQLKKRVLDRRGIRKNNT